MNSIFFCRSTAVSNLSASVRSHVQQYSTGRADKNKIPPIDFRSSGVNASSRTPFSPRRAPCTFQRRFSILQNRITLFFKIFIQTLQPTSNLVVIRRISQDPDSRVRQGINNPPPNVEPMDKSNTRITGANHATSRTMCSASSMRPSAPQIT